MRQFKGIAENIESSIFGLLTYNSFSVSRGDRVLVAENASFLSKGFAGVIAKDIGKKNELLKSVRVSGEVFDKLNEGDCVLIDKDGIITIVWEKKAPMNALFLTEVCDCKCIMCPQPPKARDGDGALIDICERILGIVKVENHQTICLSGGEPTLLREDFFRILGLISKKHPERTIMLLTNGKSFANFDFTKRFVSARPKNFLTCVSMHSDVDEVHDRIVGVEGSFYRTAMGLQNLARFREKVEIRVVISNINASHLESIAKFIYRNFPFVVHCTFMGLEITGFARDNYETVWIDPYDYREELFRAIRVLSRADIDVSIYNLPLCLVDSRSWSFARKSISGWKNDYLPICEKCSVKTKCCGIFTTSGLHQSPHIRPV